MSTGQPPPPPAVTPLPRRRLWPWLFVGGAGAVVALAVAAWLWLRPLPAVPPLPDLTGADPEVVEVIDEARRDVLGHPASARAWGKLGMVLRAHDFDDECILCFEQAERLDPREPRWPYLLGLSRVFTDPETGIRCLERAVELCGDDPSAPRLRLAEALLGTGRLDEAQAHLEQALRNKADDPRAWLGMGRLALLRGDWRAALDHLAKCAQDEHARKLAHTLRAEVWGRLGETDKSRAEQARAAELPEDVMWPDYYMEEVMELKRGLLVRFANTVALTRAGRTEDAIALAQQTAEKYPQTVEAWLRLGKLWHDAHHLDRAEQTFQKAVRVAPDMAEAWFCLGCVQALGRPREGAESFRRAIGLRPDHAQAHFNLGHCLRQLGDTAGAAEEFRATLRCRPDHARARQALQELEAPRKDRKGNY